MQFKKTTTVDMRFESMKYMKYIWNYYPCSKFDFIVRRDTFEQHSSYKLSRKVCTFHLQILRDFQKMNNGKISKKENPGFYSVDTQTGTLGRRSPNHNVFWRQKDPKFFLQTDL